MKRQQKVEILPGLVESIVGDAADVFVLFADLCGSTEYKQHCTSSNHPDLSWIVRQLIFLQRAAETIRKYKGTVVKTTGDGIIAYFEATANPEGVLKCAIEISQGYDNLKAFKSRSKIEVKVSIDFGLTYNGSIVNSVPYDPIGLPVDRCSRLNSVANNNEILFSQDFLSVAEAKCSRRDFEDKYGYKTREFDLKGIGKTTYFCIMTK